MKPQKFGGLKLKDQLATQLEMKLTNWQAPTLKRKKWTYHEGKIQTSDQKIVVPKSQLYLVFT